MPKVRKYFYNTATHRYEKYVRPLRVRLLRAVGFLSASTVTALIMVAVAYRVLPSPGEKRSLRDVQQLQEQYSALQKTLADINTDITDLEQRDNAVYRAIFETAPLPDSIRRGKRAPRVASNVYRFTPSETIIARLQEEVQTLKARIARQRLSYDTLEHLARTKEEMLAAIPAIQPVSNKDLSHIASGFGMRIDPIYKTPKLHAGLDFASAMGTPVYATANGKIGATGFDEKGYGNYVVVNHGYGYQTLYGHMVRIKARPGEGVKRGEVIGWVGNTGKSTGPHCHYEVIRNGEKTDPVHYFFNDLSAADYERLVKLAAASGQSFD